MEKIFKLSTSVLLCFVIAASAFAQPNPQHPEAENLKVPDNWEVRLDKPDESVTIGANSAEADIYFVNMTPGWHITTGPRAIFWHPESSAKGFYKASAKIHLFDPKGRNEAFGLFMGGENLKQDNQTYTYFLLRNTGEYLIKQRIGNETKVLKDWSAAPSMQQYTDSTQSSVANNLSIEVTDQEVHFFVNGKQVDQLRKDQLDSEGTVGLRINHALNLHIEDFKVEQQ